MLPYDHKNLLDGTPALLYYYLYANVKEAEKKFLGNVSIFFTCWLLRFGARTTNFRQWVTLEFSDRRAPI